MTTDEVPEVLPRRVEFLPLDDLVPDPRNPKGHSLDTIDASIGRFGMVESVVRDDRTGKIISGHGRHETLRAMEARGEQPPEGVRTDSAGRWLVPVLTGWSSRTDTEASAAIIALNRTTEMGGWVDDALLDLLDDLSEQDDGFVGVGFGESDLADLRAWVDHFDEQQNGDEPTRDLDAMGEEFGDMTEEDGWMKVVLNLPAELAARLNARIDAASSIPELVEDWLGEQE